MARMRLNRKANLMLYTLIGLILVGITVFAIINGVAKGMNLFGKDLTASSFLSLNSSIARVAGKQPGTVESVLIRLDEKSSLMAYPRGSHEIVVPRWGDDYRFPRPEECPADKACLCACRRVDYGEGGYACQEETREGKQKSSLICTSYDKIDFVDYMEEEEFGKQDWNSYELNGGFIMGRFRIMGLESRTFNVPDRSVLRVHKISDSPTRLIGLTFRQELPQEATDRAVNADRAQAVFSLAERNLREGDYESAMRYLNNIIDDPTLTTALETADPHTHNMAYYYRAIILERQEKHEEAKQEFEEIKGKFAGSPDERNRMESQAEMHICNLLQNTEGELTNFYAVSEDNYECLKCSKIRNCRDYRTLDIVTTQGEPLYKIKCEDDFCNIGCEWDSGANECTMREIIA